MKIITLVVPVYEANIKRFKHLGSLQWEVITDEEKREYELLKSYLAQDVRETYDREMAIKKGGA